MEPYDELFAEPGNLANDYPIELGEHRWRSYQHVHLPQPLNFIEKMPAWVRDRGESFYRSHLEGMQLVMCYKNYDDPELKDKHSHLVIPPGHWLLQNTRGQYITLTPESYAILIGDTDSD